MRVIYVLCKMVLFIECLDAKNRLLMDLFTVYKKMPYPVQVLIFNIKARANYNNRYKGDYRCYYSEYVENWQKPIDRLILYQRKRLQCLLEECMHFSKWYANAMRSLSVNVHEIRDDPLSVLRKMPLLTKEDRRKKYVELVNKNPRRYVRETGYTSGTSGSPTFNYLDRESIERSFAVRDRFYYTIGVSGMGKSVRFSGRVIVHPERKDPPFWIFNVFEKQLFMSSYHLSENNIPAYVDKLNIFRPTLLEGYPSALLIVSSFINRSGISLSFTPKAIITTAETLQEFQREEMRRAFNCNVYDQYASSEGAPWITECVNRRLHLNIDTGYFEFLREDNGPADPGEIARMVVTGFQNLKIPLIRYDIGDTVLLPKERVPCTCGCNMPTVEKVTGRIDDILWTAERGFVGRMDTAFKGLSGIVRSQIVQTGSDKVIVKLQVDDSFKDVQRFMLVRNIKDRLGYNVDVKVDFVRSFELGPNGKFDAVKRAFSLPLLQNGKEGV